jgi:crotonobetaine/carnitine-CoA ligase
MGVWERGEQSTITRLLDKRLDTDPDSEYVDVCGTKFSAGEVADSANRLANAFAELGAGRGERVATLLDNSAPALLAWYGAVRGGSIAVPINTAYKGEYLRHQLGDSGATVLVVQRSLADRAAEIVDSLPELQHVVVVDDEDAGPGDGARLDEAKTARLKWDELLSADNAVPDVNIRPSDLGTFVYTGGTTGPSKGCMLSHRYHEVLARQIGVCWRRSADDVVWTPLPLFHFNAIVTAVLGPLVYGGRGRRRATLLGVPVLARDEPDGRNRHLHAGDDGLPAGPRRRPARDAAVGRDRGEHDAPADRSGAAPGGDRLDRQGPIRCRHLQRRLRHD